MINQSVHVCQVVVVRIVRSKLVTDIAKVGKVMKSRALSLITMITFVHDKETESVIIDYQIHTRNSCFKNCLPVKRNLWLCECENSDRNGKLKNEFASISSKISGYTQRVIFIPGDKRWHSANKQHAA